MEKIDFDYLNTEEGPFAERLAFWIKEVLAPSSVLDAGCGPGTYVYAMRDIGVNAVGLDTDDRVIGKPHLTQKSLMDMTDEKADVVVCLEVAEHIPEEFNDKIVEKIVGAVGKSLIFTAAIPGQGGVGHINCRPRQFWLEKFTAAGLKHDIDMEEHILTYARGGYHMGWFTQNLLYFVKE